MRLRRWTALTILAVSAGGIAVLVFASPGQRTIRLSLDDKQMYASEVATTRWAEQLLASPVAAFLDPAGHDRLEHAVAIEHRVEARGSRTIEELGLDADIFGVTNAHQVSVHNTKWSMIVYLGMIFAGTLLGYILWWLDRRSDLWHAASMLIALAPMITLFIAFPSFPQPGLTVLALWVTAMVTVGRESMQVFRLRTPDEIGDGPVRPTH